MDVYTQTKPFVVDSTQNQLLHTAASRMVAMRRALRPIIQQAKNLSAAPISGHASEAQMHVLAVLADEDYLPAGEIANRCHVSDPTISKALNHLEEQGLIARTTDPDNRRAVQVRLTVAGRATMEASRAALVEGLAQVLSPLNSTQLEDIIAAMEHLESLAPPQERDAKRKNNSFKEFR